MRSAGPSRRRGSVVIIVLWTLALAALIVSSVQLFAYRQAMIGREALHRTQARWAARAGLESTLAMLALHTEQPIPDDAFALIADLEYVSSSDFLGSDQLLDATYDIVHNTEDRALPWAGPVDEHSKMNINLADAGQISLLEDITPDVVAAILDWRDEDDEPNGLLGVEREWYLGVPSSPYEPRNGPLRTVAEIELIAGSGPDYLRNEDWNLNNRLDPNEDDGLRSLPDDEPDGRLDAGWSARLTAYSVDGGATASGLPRLYLRRADPLELMDRCNVDEVQAEALIEYGKNDDNKLTDLIATPLGGVNNQAQGPGGQGNSNVPPLDDDQLRAVLAETSTYPLYERRPGRINLNTIEPDLIRDLLEARGYEETVAEEIIYMRDSRPEGITSILD
ncbi:MAG: type II secretion system protein GspK, partial [Planctomycetota bacterium]|nr:type II secretion system protein GspK [Planctomycetota bacterium]